MAVKKIRTGGHLSRDMYWCIQYLTTVIREDQQGILLGSLTLGIERAKNNHSPKRPPRIVNKRSVRVNFSIPKPLFDKMTLVRIEKELYNWGTIDFLRYGLMLSLERYRIKYPELERITRRFKDEAENDKTEELS